MKIRKLTFFLVVFTGCLTFVFGKTSNYLTYTALDATAANDSIVAPNVFTPNDDGINDVFKVTSSNGGTVSLKIFTRAGVLVFSIKAKICEWDGRSSSGEKMANGVYYYTAEVPGSSPKISKAGFVHLFR
ncbi:MAG: gliding motility-associated C-terminal domain-containing protein [Bacteroidales bacterium]|jgi:gliding motility-associated-like protein|nr:gliding motility-associated C-terminal domain-containing protein [Bacteroidales bacterium]